MATRILTCLVFGALFWGSSGKAEVTLRLPFSFAPTSARALGMGGATIAIADDATTAVDNPGGLSALQNQEVTIQYRHTWSDLNYIDDKIGFQNILIDNPRSDHIALDGDVGGIASLSYVIPLKPFGLALFYRQNNKIKSDSAHILQGESSFEGLGLVDSTALNNIDTYIDEAFGVAASFQPYDFLSLGVAMRLNQRRLDVRESFFAGQFDTQRIVGGIERIDTRIDDKDRDVTFDVGVLLKASKVLSFGLSYHQGPTFDIATITSTQSCDFDLGVVSCAAPLFVKGNLHVSVPDVWELGMAWSPTNSWLIGLELGYITYSDLSIPQDGISIDDKLVVAVGVEKSLELGGQTLLIRGGAFSDGDHDGFTEIDSNQIHYTLGLGLLAGSLQFDVGASVADNVKHLLMSAAYRF